MALRPRYETASDLARELEVVKRMLTRYPFEYTKLDDDAPADYLLHEHGVNYFVVEVKNRSCSRGQYRTYKISQAKLERLTRFAANRNVVPLLAVRWSDGFVGVVRVAEALKFARFVVGGRTDRNDERDIEMMAEFDISLFQMV